MISALTVSWQPDAPVPAVVASWGGRGFTVQERFYCPSASRARLAREVTITNRGTELQVGWVRTSVPGSTACAGSHQPARMRVCSYDLTAAAGPRLTAGHDRSIEADARASWSPSPISASRTPASTISSARAGRSFPRPSRPEAA
jgi:hypothetical protein